MGRLRTLTPGIATLDTRIAQPPPKITDPVYHTPEWRALVASLITARGPYCQDPKCRFPGRKPSRLFGDHIIELKDGGPLLDPKNVLLRCGSCHTRKTNEVARSR